MKNIILTTEIMEAFALYLAQEERSGATIEKYGHDIQAFYIFAKGRYMSKEVTLEYKKKLIEGGYAVRSINSMLAAVNSLLIFMGLPECRIKTMKIQRQTYSREEKEISKAEYYRLLNASKGKPRLNLLLQTLCATGIRVSELRYFTVKTVQAGEVTVSSKNKTRNIFVPDDLRKKLLNYAKRRGIKSGVIFCTRSGKPLDRSNIWTQMKKLCEKAGVNPAKVFPHNLRKLFARTFYKAEKDIAKLADILGHSSIDTTRIYIMSTGAEHRRRIEQLGLVS